MGRIAQGFQVFDRGGRKYVRFTHAAADYRVALGTSDPREAASRAAAEYSAVVSGRKRALTRPDRAGRPLLTFAELIAEWINAQTGVLDPETCRTLETYGRHYRAFFKSADHLTHEACKDYGRARIRLVLRRTVLKELSFLRNFLAWCVDEKVLVEAPVVPIPKRTSTGVRVGRQRAKPVEISDAEAVAILEQLPLASKTIGGRSWPLRARFVFAWETGLRPTTLARLQVPNNFRRGQKVLVLDDADDKARYGRTLPLSPLAIQTLEAVAPSEGLIFGKHCFNKHLKKAALPVLGEHDAKRFASYDFRHGMATHLVDEGASLTGVAYLLGHRRLSTTDRYSKPNQRAAERALMAVGAPSFEVEKPEVAKLRNSPSGGIPAQFPPIDSGGGGAPPEKPSDIRGDRRVSNPRQLEPQRNRIVSSSENHERFESREGSQNGHSSPCIRPMGGKPPAWVHEATAGLYELLARAS